MRRLACASILFGCTEANPSASTTSTDETGADGDATTDASTGESGSPSTSGSVDSVGEETGDDACPGAQVCVGSPPAGWSGPAIVFEDTPTGGLPECNEDYPEMVVQAYHGLQAEPATCTCTCSEPANVGCTDWFLERHAEAGCPDPVEEFQYLGFCLNAPSEPAGGYWRAVPSPIFAFPCEASGSMEIDPPTFATRTTICGALAPPAQSCGDDLVCMPLAPDGFESDLCIWQPGDLECPAGTTYSQRRVIYGTVADGRSCETCTCGEPEGTCMVDMEFHATACSDEIMTVLPADGSCVQIDHPVEAVHGEDTSLVIDASCPPSPGQPIGEAVGEAPVTVCCSG